MSPPPGRRSLGLRCGMVLALGAVLAAAPCPAQDAAVREELTHEVVDAAARGLAFLARVQQPDGSWLADSGYKVNQDYHVRQAGVPHVGVTALCGMAFLAGGHLPGRGPYGEHVDRAITYLMGQSNDLGYISAHLTRMYSHAFATLFLAEVYGTTPRPEVQERLQNAVSLIAACQNEQGSWRYEPFAIESDMSITVCQLMALRAARNSGIKVPSQTIDRAVEYVVSSLVRTERDIDHSLYPSDYYRTGIGAFKYQKNFDERSSFALTAAGVTSLYHAARYDRTLLRNSLRFLEEVQDLVSYGEYSTHFFYYYGHYYAVQAMYITGGEYWNRYWKQVSEELLRRQRSDGSWPNPVGPGPNFGTAVACIVLQTPNRYLPILQR